MTALLAVVGSRLPFEVETARRALRQSGSRAAGRCAVVLHERDAFGVACPGALAPGRMAAPECLLVADERFTVVADATIYYAADLQRAISRRVTRDTTPAVPGCSPAQLILAAYRAFGDSCVEYIEGDFAFVVWDRLARRLFCARDLSGRRPLYYAPCAGGLAVASTLATFASIPGIVAEPDVATVGSNAAGLFFALDDETSMLRTRSLGSGCSIAWRAGRPPALRRFWTPSTAVVSDLDFHDAAENLRALLRAATVERLADRAPTAVWMSGGRDSTAVFASGMAAIRDHATQGTIFPVSRSHPRGDTEREDEAIETIASFWGTAASWVDARDVPLFGDDDVPTPWSTESFEQPFARLTRALTRATAAGGASVALDGHGGDFLFQVSRVYLADLVARRQFRQAWRDWRTMDRGREGLRGLVRAGLQPHVSRLARRATLATLHSRLRGPMERVAPPWIRQSFLAQHGIPERSRLRGLDARPGHDAADRETTFCLTHPFFANVNAAMAGYALEHGVELRSPLLDRRIVDFALTRPREERNLAGDQKRLLRAALRGLLPDSALAPRQEKTGTLRTYFAYHMHNEGLARLRGIGDRWLLADHDIVDARALASAVVEFAARGPSYRHTEALYCTLQAEQWLRVHAADGSATEFSARRSA